MASGVSPGRRTSTATTSSTFSITQGLKSSPAAFQASIVDKEGNIGIVLDKPEASLLVLYLEQKWQSSGSRELSFLAIQREFRPLLPPPSWLLSPSLSNTVSATVDEEALIDTEACDCRKPGNTCRRSAIQRHKGKPLLMRRPDVASDLDAWNLAMLGRWQRDSLPVSKEKMMWIAIDFETVEDRVSFGDVFGQLMTLFGRQKSLYHMDWRNLQV
jgi:hypothetical protein